MSNQSNLIIELNKISQLAVDRSVLASFSKTLTGSPATTRTHSVPKCIPEMAPPGQVNLRPPTRLLPRREVGPPLRNRFLTGRRMIILVMAPRRSLITRTTPTRDWTWQTLEDFLWPRLTLDRCGLSRRALRKLDNFRRKKVSLCLDWPSFEIYPRVDSP